MIIGDIKISSPQRGWLVIGIESSSWNISDVHFCFLFIDIPRGTGWDTLVYLTAAILNVVLHL